MKITKILIFVACLSLIVSKSMRTKTDDASIVARFCEKGRKFDDESDWENKDTHYWGTNTESSSKKKICEECMFFVVDVDGKNCPTNMKVANIDYPTSHKKEGTNLCAVLIAAQHTWNYGGNKNAQKCSTAIKGMSGK